MKTSEYKNPIVSIYDKDYLLYELEDQDIKPVNNPIPSILTYLDDISMTPDDLDEEVEFIMDNFLIKRAIHMLYASAGSGKTYLAIGIALNILKEKKAKKVIYMDMDNSKATLKKRGVEKIIERYKDFKLISRGKGSKSAPDLLKDLAKSSKKDKDIFDGYVFIFDSIRNFLGKRDMNSDKDIIPLMEQLLDIRDQGGATIIFLHHTSRGGDGEAYKGSGSFMDSSDEGYAIKKTRKGSVLSFELTPYKGRLDFEAIAFDLHTDGEEIELIPQNYQEKNMLTVELEVVNNTQKLLGEKKDGLSQSELLKELGKTSNDGTTIKYLKKYVGEYWNSERIPKQNNKIIYYPLNDQDSERSES